MILGLLLIETAGQVSAQSGCERALILTTYQASFSHDMNSYLATLVTRDEYDTLTHDGRANVVIYDIPIGIGYNDFHNRAVAERQASLSTISDHEAYNVLYTALDPNSHTDYQECLDKQSRKTAGLHLAVEYATYSEIAIKATWNIVGEMPQLIIPKWGSAVRIPAGLPKTLTAGDATFTLPRPKEEMTLTVNYPGYSDFVVLTPLPRDIPPTRQWGVPCTKSNEGFCEICEVDVSSPNAGIGIGGTVPFQCDHMKPGSQVMGVYRGKWQIVNGPPDHELIEIGIETPDKSCLGQWQSCWSRFVDHQIPNIEISDADQVPLNGTSSWQLRVFNCSIGHDSHQCFTSGHSKAKIFSFDGTPWPRE